MKSEIMKQQTAMQQLLAYVKHNGQSWRGISADMIEKEFIPLEKEQTIQFHIECMKAGLIVEGERKWDEDYEPIVKAIAEKHYSETYENPNT